MKMCPNGHQMPDEATFCGICGAPVSIQQFLASMGIEALTCPWCNNPLDLAKARKSGLVKCDYCKKSSKLPSWMREEGNSPDSDACDTLTGFP